MPKIKYSNLIFNIFCKNTHMFLGCTGKYNSSGSKVDGSASSKTRTGKKITLN
jgi:hypothetical protein